MAAQLFRGPVPWSLQSELHISFVADGDAMHGWRVEGLAGFTKADPRIVAAGTATPAGPHLILRPLTLPPGPFDLAGLLWITPFVEVAGARETLVAFEERIGRRYYEYIAGARFRYAAACDVQASGLPLGATCAEVYSIDAQTKAEAEELDASLTPQPPDVAAFYAECRALKVPGSGRQVWMFPREP
jgi:hypothetical protein